MPISLEQLHQMEERVKATVGTHLKPVPAAVQPIDVASVLFVQPEGYDLVEFTYRGMPVGKPRQTQRDKWQKRPCVLRYRAFADGLRATARAIPQNPDMLIVTAWVPMPVSWPQKKKDELVGQPHRQKSDWDNLGKAVSDALFKEDSCIWVGATIKYWCQAGQESVNVKILYAKPKQN